MKGCQDSACEEVGDEPLVEPKAVALSSVLESEATAVTPRRGTQREPKISDVMEVRNVESALYMSLILFMHLMQPGKHTKKHPTTDIATK